MDRDICQRNWLLLFLVEVSYLHSEMARYIARLFHPLEGIFRLPLLQLQLALHFK